jgi:putative ABC transport system permease protein
MNIGPIIRAMKHSRTRVVLIVLEIALTLAIVTNCVNVILAERTKMTRRSGFDDDNIVMMHVRPFSAEYREPGFIDTSIDRDLRTIQATPGVRAVVNTHFKPWEGGGAGGQVFAVGDSREPVRTQTYYATRDIIPALGMTIVEGRGFRDGDHGTGPAVDPADHVLISKSVADLLFPGQSAVGKQIQEGSPDQPEEDVLTVVGVIGEFFNPFGRATSLNPNSDKVMFRPARNGGYVGGIQYLIRTEPGKRNAAVTAVEKRLIALNAGRVLEFQSVEEKKEGWFASSRIVVTTMTCIIVALVAVTALGLLGLTSLSVAERTRQIGTRRALGATRGAIVRHFLIENWIVTTAGLVLGVAGAYGLNFLLLSHVSDVKLPWELVAGGMLLLWMNGLISTIPAAVRASAVSPSIATRSV